MIVLSFQGIRVGLRALGHLGVPLSSEAITPWLSQVTERAGGNLIAENYNKVLPLPSISWDAARLNDREKANLRAKIIYQFDE
ncbi:MAG: hypothetical protein V4484_22995 [Pseudomonadota bacterium]